MPLPSPARLPLGHSAFFAEGAKTRPQNTAQDTKQARQAARTSVATAHESGHREPRLWTRREVFTRHPPRPKRALARSLWAVSISDAQRRGEGYPQPGIPNGSPHHGRPERLSTIRVWSSAPGRTNQTSTNASPKKRTPSKDERRANAGKGLRKPETPARFEPRANQGRTKGLRNPQHHPCVVLTQSRESRAETPRTGRAHHGAMFRPTMNGLPL